MGEIQISSEAAMLSALPAAGTVKLFINTDKNNVLYYIDSNGEIKIYSANDMSSLEECCSCEIAKKWANAVTCALQTGMIKATEFGTIINQGFVVNSTESIDPDTGAKTCTVEIGPKNAVPQSVPASIQLFFDTDLKVGNSKNIFWYIFPLSANQNVTFSSSNNSILTVNSSGLVTGISVGTAIVTVTSVVNPSVSSTLSITVVP